MKKLACILLVEDNEFINIYNKTILEHMQIADHVEVIDDSSKALEYLLQAGKTANGSCPYPDLIFLDINMPCMNGWELITEYLRATSARQAHAKFVILSAAPNQEDLGKQAGFPEVLCFERKPLTKEKINSILLKYFKK